MESRLLGRRVRGRCAAVLLAGVVSTALVAVPAQAGGPVARGGDIEPTVKIKKGPPKKTESKRAKFTFVADESPVTFFCKLDKGPTEECTSPKSYRKLKLGLHRFHVYAVDPAGNRDEGADYAWRIKKEV